MPESDRKHPVTITREELFRQVWETPMSRLAGEYGISGNGLAKICDRLDVPYPPRGYWAKVAAGQKVVKYRLPPAKKGIPAQTTIRPTPPPEPKPETPVEVRKAIEKTKAESAEILVADRILRPHRIIADWIEDREKRVREARRERDPNRRKWMMPEDISDSTQRQHRILDALFKALEKRGGRVTEGDRKELIAEMNGEPIEFLIRQKQKRGRRPLSDFEKSYATRDDKGWRFQMEVTETLVFVIKTHLPGNLPSDWQDTDETPLESLLPDIVATFVAAGPLLVQRRKEREEQERQRLIAERLRYEEQQRRKKDDNRWRKFVQFAEQHREAELARTFLEALKAADMDPSAEFGGRTLAEWIAWAEDRLVNGDPLNAGPEGVFKALAGVSEWSS